MRPWLDITIMESCMSEGAFPISGDEASVRSVILSIRPDYASSILTGQKTVELRRRFPLSMRGATAYIYVTSPTKALVGQLNIAEIQCLPLPALWKQHGKAASIQKRAFFAYFDGRDEGFALQIARVRPLARQLPLMELRERFGFIPPQSFAYAKPDLQRTLRNERSALSD
jgi:predicted transcriptional regulator